MGRSLVLGLLCACFLHLATRLPVTLFGDGIYDSPWNIPWLFILGYLYGLPGVVFGWNGLFYALFPAVVMQSLTVLSNLKSTKKIFTWDFVEGLVGASVMISLMKGMQIC